ncbi:hypothetical protein ACX0G9_30820 [Flavitalea flava]
MAISLKTVNAEKNFKFANIFENIKELGALKRAGSNAQYGRGFKLPLIIYNQVISIMGAIGKTINETFAWIKNKDEAVR